MKNELSKIVLCLSLLGATLASHAQVTTQPAPDQVYRVRIPARSNSCSEEAKNLAEGFKKATGINPVKSTCTGAVTISEQGQNHTLYSLTLLYPAGKTPDQVSIKYGHMKSPIIGGPNEPGDYYGIYTSYQACLDALDDKTDEFERFTELHTVSSYCSKARLDDAYVLTVEGFGTPKQRLYTFDSSVGSRPDRSLQQEVLLHLQQKGVTIVDIVGSRLFYYSERPTDLRQKQLLSYQSEETCNLQLDEARMIVNGFDKTSQIVRCIQAGGTTQKVFNLVGILSNSTYLSNHMRPERYVSLEECLADIPRVASAHTYYYGRAAFGALCAFDSLYAQPEQFKMEVFSSL